MIDGSYKCHITYFRIGWRKNLQEPLFLMRNTSFVLNFLFTHPLNSLRFLHFFLRCPFSLGLQPFERSISMSCRASTGCSWPEVSQCFFFPLHQRQGLKSLKSTWFTVRGCIPTLKCFRDHVSFTFMLFGFLCGGNQPGGLHYPWYSCQQ